MPFLRGFRLVSLLLVVSAAAACTKLGTTAPGARHPYTIAHTLIRAMKVSLKKIKDEGLDNILARQARNAQATHTAA